MDNKNEMIIHGLVHDIKLSEPTLHVDNESRNRSGHMGHAMVNMGNGKILAFNSNVSAERCDGHSGFGWMEYRISEDYGESFSKPRDLPYSKEKLFEGIHSILVEKAVYCDDGSIVAFGMSNDMLLSICCDPHGTPSVIRSTDGGETWEEAYELCSECGRIYDAKYHKGSIYVLEFCNDGKIDFRGTDDEKHLYRIYKSDDSGKSFYELTVVPFKTTIMRAYGALHFDNDGNLLVYAYNSDNEKEMDYVLSRDGGKTFSKSGTCHLEKRIRNPQIALLNGQFILHGRDGGASNAFVFYTSGDGIHFDEGTLVEPQRFGCCYYSNNVIVNKDGKDRLLVQYSKTYKGCRVNVMHMWIDTI